MANTMLDKRRTDLRGTTLENPYWVTSAEIDKDYVGYEGVLFDFPLTGGNTNSKGLTIIESICFEVTTEWAGGTITLDVGLGTIPLITTTDLGTVTITNADEYIINTEITEGTVGTYFSAASDFVTALAAGTFGSPVKIIHLDVDIPVIYVTVTTNTTITAGAGRVHALLNRVPLLG